MCSLEDRTGINELKLERSGIGFRKITQYGLGSVMRNWFPFPRKCLSRHWWSIAMDVVKVISILENNLEDIILNSFLILQAFHKQSSKNSLKMPLAYDIMIWSLAMCIWFNSIS